MKAPRDFDASAHRCSFPVFNAFRLRIGAAARIPLAV
jgi:hypothetical protein